MSTKIFVNLPVKDVKRSLTFFEALGWTINKQFSGDESTCVVISEDIYAMLLSHKHFGGFTTKQIPDATKTAQVLIALSQDSKAAVHRIVDAALKAGATEPRPMADHGFMINRTFDDLDGHTWEILYMDPSFVQPQ